MRSKLGPFIRSARRAAGLTQVQLGVRLGLKGRAVYRWETSDSAPTKRHQREMVSVIRAVNPDAAASLATAFAAERRVATPDTALPTAPQPPAPSINPNEALELAVLRLADELDLPPRRLRRPLVRLLGRMQATDFTLAAAQQHLETWITEQQ